MDAIAMKYITEMNSKYVFIILQGDFSKFDIMSILLRGRVMSRDAYITLYAPYKELITAYSMKFPESKMWGIGFLTEALNKAKLIGSKEAPTYTHQCASELRSLQIIAKGLDFSELKLDKGEAFAVVPNKAEMEKVCFHGSKTVGKKEFHLWWCKGLRNDVCGGKSDDDLKTYLDGTYSRFYRQNFINDIKEQDVLPQNRLIEETEREYSLLNLTPEELLDCSKRGMGTVGVLF